MGALRALATALQSANEKFHRVSGAPLRHAHGAPCAVFFPYKSGNCGPRSLRVSVALSPVCTDPYITAVYVCSHRKTTPQVSASLAISAASGGAPASRKVRNWVIIPHLKRILSSKLLLELGYQLFKGCSKCGAFGRGRGKATDARGMMGCWMQRRDTAFVAHQADQNAVSMGLEFLIYRHHARVGRM